MLIKLLLVAALSISISCFAQSGDGKSKSLIDTNQQTQSSTGTNQQNPSSQSDSLKKRNSQATQDANSEKKPSMVELCRNSTC